MTVSKLRLTKKDFFSFVLLGIFCLYVFRDIILRGHLLFGTDFFSFYLGMKQFLYDEIHQHHTIPGWNPFVFGGIPFWAHLESTIFYPLDILFWFMPPEKAYGYTVFLHVYLAGAFMFLFCRSLGVPTAGALVSALCFMLSGMMMATVYDGQMFRVQAFTWLPLILFLVHRALSMNGALFPSIMAGFFWGIQMMSGAPQDALYTLIAVILFIPFMADWTFRHSSSALRAVKTLGILLVVGFGVAAVQLVPSYEFIRESVRGDMKQYSLITMGSYPPEGVITWLMPHFYGRFAENNFWVADVPWSVPLYNLYLGVLPVYLLFFLSPGESGSRRTTVFALALGLLCFVLALGSNTPLYEFIVMLPGFDKVRAPSKIIILWALAMALLAGMGMHGLHRLSKGSLRRRLGIAFGVLLSVIALDAALHAERALTLKLFSPFFLDQAIPGQWGFAESLIRSEWHRFTILSAIIVFVIFVSVRGLLSMPLAASLLCGLLFLDLAYVNRGAVRHDDRIYAEAGRVKEELGAALGQDKTVFRVGSSKSGWGANFEMYLGYQSVGGYNPLFLQRYYEYLNQYRFHGRPVPEGWIVFFYEEHDHHILMDLLNVKYEISHETKTLGLRETHRPRAFLVSGAEVVEKKEEILDALIKPGFDPAQIVLLEKGTPEVKLPRSGKESRPNLGTVSIVSYRPDSIALSVHSISAALLFLSEVYYPGWKAYVDGQATEILRGNYLFRVLEVPEGQHEVRIVFDPWTTKAGTGITLLTLLLILALPVFQKLKTRVPAARRPHSFPSR
jgi:hypothetical protein